MLRDPEKTKNEIVEWIRNYFEENGKAARQSSESREGRIPA